MNVEHSDLCVLHVLGRVCGWCVPGGRLKLLIVRGVFVCDAFLVWVQVASFFDIEH